MNRKVVIRQPGGLDEIGVIEEAEPVPADGEAKIRILAAGAAYGDIMLRRGVTGGRFPVTPGYDLVGVIETVPPTSTFRVGDQVAALSGLGGQQTIICLPEHELVAVPPNVLPEKAVCVVLNYVTAYQLLVRSARLRRGNTAFIYGLAGGVGTAMQQIAGELGIALYGTASSGRLEAARRGGATVFNRDDPDWATLFDASLPGGVDAVFDPIGGANLYRSFELLAPKGKLVVLGASSAVQGDGNAKLKIAGTLARIVTLKLRHGSRRTGVYHIERAKKAHHDEFREDLTTLLGWLAAGKIDPVIDRVLPLAEARHAQELLESSHVTGKIVLKP